MSVNNLNSNVLKDIQSKLNTNLAVKDKQIQDAIDTQNSNFEKMLKSSKIADKNIEKMLSEINRSSGNYQKRIEELTKQYIEEQKASNNLSEEQSMKIQDMMKSIEDNQKLQEQKQDNIRKQEAKQNPLKAFTHAFDKFKETGSVKAGASQLGTSLKDSFNLKNVSKAVLHSAGVALDNPALNILASEIKHNTEQSDEEIQKTQEFIDSLNGDSKTFDDIQEVLTEEKEINGDIMRVLEDTYQDHGALIENLHRESMQSNIYFNELIGLQKETLFHIKDAKDDSKSSSIVGVSKSSDAGVPEGEESNIFDDLDIPGMGGLGDKRKKKGKGKTTGSSLKGMFKGAAKFGKLALKAVPVVGILATAGFAIADGVDGFNKASETFGLRAEQQATASEKFASTLGSVAEGLTLGFLSSKDIAKSIDSGLEQLGDIFQLDSISDFFTGTSKESSKVAERLEQSGVIDKSFIGDSRINDWNAIEGMNIKDIIALKKFDDWSDSDLKRFDQIIASKSTSVPRLDSEDLRTPSEGRAITTATPTEVAQAEVRTENTSPTPVIVQQTPSATRESKSIDDYSIDNMDLITTMKLHGVDTL